MASLAAWSSAGVQSLLTVRHRPSRFQQVIEAVVDIFQQEPAVLVDDDAGGLVAVFVVLQQEAMGRYVFGSPLTSGVRAYQPSSMTCQVP